MATRSFKQRVAPALPHSQWRTQAIGTNHFLLINCILGLNVESRFAEKLIRASKGEKGIVEPTYIYLPGVPGGVDIAKEVGVDYFSVPVELGVCPPFPGSVHC